MLSDLSRVASDKAVKRRGARVLDPMLRERRMSPIGWPHARLKRAGRRERDRCGRQQSSRISIKYHLGMPQDPAHELVI